MRASHRLSRRSQLFGTLDVGGKYFKNDGRSKQWSEETDGINSSEIRFQGIEDLGGGLKAGFNLRSGIDSRHRHPGQRHQVLESSRDRQPVQQCG